MQTEDSGEKAEDMGRRLSIPSIDVSSLIITL